MIESVLLNLPTIISYWSGFLLAWSLGAIVGLLIIIKQIYNKRHRIRHGDLISLTFVAVGATALVTNLFILPNLAVAIMDVTLGINLWYTLFLTYVTGTSLKLLPHFCCKSIQKQI